MLALPAAPPQVVPFIARHSAEATLKPPLILNPQGLLAYEDETPQDRDSFGMLWVRTLVLPPEQRGEPQLDSVNPYRQRQAMDDLLCQVCQRPPEDMDAPSLFLMRNTGGPVKEGELTTSPPVCVPCAAIAIQLCGALRGGRYVAAWVDSAPHWGVAGLVYNPLTLTPVPGRGLERVEYGTAFAPWTVAARTVTALYGVRPADLEAEFARLGTDRLEEEFARVAELVGVP
ncbi:hypothetical protein F3K39_20945 [Streptomyces sp. LBUM 1479]|nr:hypothetical protein [Streptomyces sp. LBUM 1479]